jgi:hypothetical protein
LGKKCQKIAARRAYTESWSGFADGLSGKFITGLDKRFRWLPDAENPSSSQACGAKLRVFVPESNIENVRMACNESGHCWRERGERRVIIREHHDGQAQPKTNYDSPRYSANSHYI